MDELRTDIIRDILKFGALLQRVGDRTLRPFGISQQEFAVLSVIVREGKPLNQSTIVVDLLVERSNLSKVVSRLTKKGLIEIRRTGADRRVRLLNALPEGRDLFHRADLALKNWNKEWMEGFSRDDLVSLRNLLHRLNSHPLPDSNSLER